MSAPTIYTDVARDPVTGRTIWKGGAPVMVSGVEAVRSWASAALRTVRGRYPMFDEDYGCEIETLIGHVAQQDAIVAEIPRIIRDALCVSPNITAVRDIQTTVQDSTLTVRFTVDTIFGEVEMSNESQVFY